MGIERLLGCFEARIGPACPAPLLAGRVIFAWGQMMAADSPAVVALNLDNFKRGIAVFFVDLAIERQVPAPVKLLESKASTFKGYGQRSHAPAF